jgi:hypothetical protein
LILEPEYQQVSSIPLVFSASSSWINQVERFFAKITDDESRSVYFTEKSPIATLRTRTGVLPPAPHAPWAKIGLVNLDFAGKGPGFLRHLHLKRS